MSPITNSRTLFNEVPIGYPEPGRTTVHDTSVSIDLETEPLKGGFLVKTLVLSIDPYLRGKMREATKTSYSAPFAKGEPITNFGIGVVLRSEHSGIKVGDHIYGVLPFQEYFVRSDASSFAVIANEVGLPWSVYIGMAGMPGQTAYVGWNEFSKAKKGETAFITTAAGPVGSFVVQLAKLDGLKVIASAGSDEKVEFVRSLGADVVFNYKKESTEEVLQREGGLDIYWDNVGGETLDLALKYANKRARFIECGMITTYNNPDGYGVKNLAEIFKKDMSMHGFINGNWFGKYREQFYKEVPKLVKEGKIQYQEDITRGLEHAGQGILDVQQGTNKGKKVILVADE